MQRRHSRTSANCSHTRARVYLTRGTGCWGYLTGICTYRNSVGNGMPFTLLHIRTMHSYIAAMPVGLPRLSTKVLLFVCPQSTKPSQRQAHCKRMQCRRRSRRPRGSYDRNMPSVVEMYRRWRVHTRYGTHLNYSNSTVRMLSGLSKGIDYSSTTSRPLQT